MATTAVNSIGGRIDPDHSVEVEPSGVRAKVDFGGEVIAESGRTLLLREDRHEDVYYFPKEDVRMDMLTPTDRSTHCPYKGDASYWTLQAGGRELQNGAWSYLDPLEERPEIKGYIAFYQRDVDEFTVDGKPWR